MGPRGGQRDPQALGEVQEPARDRAFRHATCTSARGSASTRPTAGTFETGDGCEFRRGFRCELGGPDTVVRFGRQCVATYDVLIQCTTSVDIGDRVMFGQAVPCFDGNHHFKDPELPMLTRATTSRPLDDRRRRDDATKCTIVPDLGERAVVGRELGRDEGRGGVHDRRRRPGEADRAPTAPAADADGRSLGMSVTVDPDRELEELRAYLGADSTRARCADTNGA